MKGTRPLKLITVLLALTFGYEWRLRLAAAVQCEFVELPKWLRNLWLKSRNNYKKLAAVFNLGEDITPELIIWMLELGESNTQTTYCVLKFCHRHKLRLPFSILDQFRFMPQKGVDEKLICEFYSFQNYPWKKTKRWYEDGDWWECVVALLATDPAELPLDILKRNLKYASAYESYGVILAARKKHLPIETLSSWYEECVPDLARSIRASCFARNLVEVCAGRNDAKTLLRDVLSRGNEDLHLTYEAAKSYKGIELTREEQLELLSTTGKNAKNDLHTQATLAALFYAFPTSPAVAEVAEKIEKFGHVYNRSGCYFPARDAARYAIYHADGRTLPYDRGPVRTVSVRFGYKKCLGNVLITAEIPPEATVRGVDDGKCRTDKAVIVEIEGRFFGEKVGISGWDSSAAYHEGDVIEIADFDTSETECSDGFHFFKNRLEAIRWNP